MTYEKIFKRYELKYIITPEQKNLILQSISPYMGSDKYGRTTIRNLYFDTDTYRLIRQSIEKPLYKEKLRIRSYSKAVESSPVFIELKKKYKSVVYKRRISLTEKDSMQWLCEGASCPITTQISQEIDYFMSYYENLHPVLFLAYEREAFKSKDDIDFRITFDENIRCRGDRLSLKEDCDGIPILEKDKIIMEIKSSMGIPLWMTEILSQNKLYKTSFSKYGTAYKNIIYPKIKEDIFHV